jgi:hypothetical protein
MNQVEMLNSIIEERNQVIAEMKEDLINEKKKIGIDMKQLEIYEKNLKNKNNKNLELSKHIEILQKYKLELEENLKNLKTDYLELSDRFKLIEGEKNLESSKNIPENESKTKIENLNTLKDNGDQMQILGDHFIPKDKLDEMEEKIDSLNRLCCDQREKINKLESDLEHKISIIEALKERLQKALSPKSEEIKYKLPIEELFSKSKFSEIKNALLEMGISLVEELKEKSLLEFLGEGIKNIDLGSRILEDYFSGKTSWEVKTHLCKGEKLSKIFNRQRKLLNYFSDNYMEFASDIDDFDFNILTEEGFSKEHLEKFKETLNEYNKQRKI